MKKVILLTGASDGIGLALAKRLVVEGHTLLLHGRNKIKLEQVKQSLLLLQPSAYVRLYQADFSKIEDAHRMVEEVKSDYSSIDVLINNAGIFVTDKESEFTEDGFDVRFSVNTIAPYILTTGLMELLHENSRVVNLSSAAQAPLNYIALTTPNSLSASEAYAQSKLGITMMTKSFSEEYPNGPVFVAVNPKSFLGSKMVKKAYGHDGYDIEIGVDILYRASFSSEFENASGQYYDNDYQCFDDPHPYAMNPSNRLKLMEFLHQF